LSSNKILIVIQTHADISSLSWCHCQNRNHSH